ncbi:MAG: molybdopterin-dependent oxidoreductase, partial [Candidatus Bathyarchaeia archaeon]
MNSENYAVKIIGCHNGGPGCWAKCGLLAYVDRKTGRLVKVEGDPENPVSKGYVCNYIPASAARWLYHPDQLMFPLKRVGERGENKWQRITWDQALDEIAGKLKEIKEKHGPECVATFEGTYRSDLYWARARFLNAYGCPANVADAGNICTTAQVAMQTQMLGSNTNPDIWLSKCIFIDGRDFAESFPLHWQVIQLRRKRGETLKLIAVDPRLTETVRNSDLWLQLRPA